MRLLIVFFCVFCLSAEVCGQESWGRPPKQFFGSILSDSGSRISRTQTHMEFPVGNYVFVSPPNLIIVGQDTIYPPSFGRWLVDSWDAYVKWADSLVYRPTGFFSVDLFRRDSAWAKPDSTWQKREWQPSFNSFIEYLRRKLKQGEQ